MIKLFEMVMPLQYCVGAFYSDGTSVWTGLDRTIDPETAVWKWRFCNEKMEEQEPESEKWQPAIPEVVNAYTKYLMELTSHDGER